LEQFENLKMRNTSPDADKGAVNFSIAAPPAMLL